jgi:hypothetical protein
MAFLEMISIHSSSLDLPLSRTSSVRLDARPIVVTVPVTTVISDAMSDDAEEPDTSTLGNFNLEGDE